MALVQDRLELHDVRDAHALAAWVIARSGLVLSYHDREDLEAYLVETAWELSRDFDPINPSFSTYATRILRRRVVDWQRARGGRRVWKFKNRTYERPRVELVSLDERDSLAETLAENSGDASADRDADRRWLLAERDRCRGRDLAEFAATTRTARAG